MSGDGAETSETDDESYSDNHEDETITTSLNPSSPMSYKALIIAFLIVVSSAYFYSNSSSLFSETTSQYIYSVVFDAGSTGTRMFVFCFKKRGTDISDIILQSEIFQSVEPGISVFSGKPDQLIEHFQPLLQEAIENVPENFQSATLVMFKATAGLRLLHKAKADQIISVVGNMLLASPFTVKDANSVAVMSGQEEGLFAWIGVNYLLDFIWNQEIRSTVTVFDLGGGSLQIAFEISGLNILNNVLIRDILRTVLHNAEFNVFTKSYLGYGLKSARLGILGVKEGPNGMIDYDPDISDKLDTHVILLSSCHTTGTNFSFIHGDSSYILKGKNPSSNVVLECKEIIDKFVMATNIVQNPEMIQHEIHLLSYFFDVAKWAKLIPLNEKRYLLTPNDFYNASKKYCEESNFSTEQPFLCIDLLYVHSVLTTGAGLKPDKRLNVEAQLLGREISWTLGAALFALSEKFFYSPIF